MNLRSFTPPLNSRSHDEPSSGATRDHLLRSATIIAAPSSHLCNARDQRIHHHLQLRRKEELAGVATTSEQPPSLHLRSQGRKEQAETLIWEREGAATCHPLNGH